MKFFLDLPLEYSPDERINFRQPLLLYGSCFSESIGQLLVSRFFNATINPNGIVFNPLCISDIINRVIEKREYHASDLVNTDGLWHSWFHHGSFSAETVDEVLSIANRKMREALKVITSKSPVLVFTFGTAYSWKHKKSESRVVNCHKISGIEFEKCFDSPEVISKIWIALIGRLRVINPEIRFIFSVSPVRYIRDGIQGNARSKASLITAVHDICNKTGSTYFPAYELVTDVLRDYRYYKDDLVHPNEMAVRFVWEKFSQSIFDVETRGVLSDIERFIPLSQHRPLHPFKLKEHLEAVSRQRESLQNKYPELNWGSH